ncbi:hypothetical protein NSK_006517 [Nannochloropsis salina CCMP1776]|uniref:RmlD-like substrate binding domain-containing protein n=1 Tax=Nannochloropsis salina CCMP1776 TaxID=1027361 RepID=A0A4D9D0L2_9STRA|nr:hypothetical protein NSK_006517 [Nannochloropsis salina CCMP1776]|eukprot:TFJ82188.1 hypothetical protein NSK_006517 [Nannochloropsis salina CCMP1776]
MEGASSVQPKAPTQNSPPRVLITGGNGYVAQHLIKALFPRAQANEICLAYTYNARNGVDPLAASLPGPIKDHVLAHRADLEDSDSLHRAVAACKPDAVMHLAGKKGGNGYNPEPRGRGTRREAVGRSRDWNWGGRGSAWRRGKTPRDRSISPLSASLPSSPPAMSSPAACARNPEKAMRVNCPLALLDALALHSPEALLVFFSTDQVFSGTVSPPALYSEAGESGRREEEEPVNVYGRSKRAFERAIQDRWPRHLILRSSNIIGPPSPFLRQGKFLQWLDELLESSVGPLELFDDECRSFLYLQDVLSLLCALLDSCRPFRPSEGPTAGGNVGRGEPVLGTREGEDAKDASSLPRASLPASAGLLVGTYNMGGPDALTRVDLGRLVWRARGGERGDCSGRIVPVRRASLNLNFESPLNIGMDSGKLRQDAGRLAFPGTSMEIAIPELLSQE